MSNLGKDMSVLWNGSVELDKVVLKQVDSGLKIDSELERKIETTRIDPGFLFTKHDGKLWRYESSYSDNEDLKIEVSPTSYAVHHVLSGRKGMPMGSYALPIGVNTMQIIKDNKDSYILLGLLGENSDHPGLVLAGSTFIRREEKIGDAIIRGCITKTAYKKEGFKIPIEKAMVIGIVYGDDSGDIGIAVYLPNENLSMGSVMPNGNAYKKLIAMPIHPDVLKKVLEKKEYENMHATDQLIGSLIAYQIKNAM